MQCQKCQFPITVIEVRFLGHRCGSCYNAQEERIFVSYESGDEIIHTDEHPVCDEDDCPCHKDEKAVSSLLSSMFP